MGTKVVWIRRTLNDQKCGTSTETSRLRLQEPLITTNFTDTIHLLQPPYPAIVLPTTPIKGTSKKVSSAITSGLSR